MGRLLPLHLLQGLFQVPLHLLLLGWFRAFKEKGLPQNYRVVRFRLHKVDGFGFKPDCSEPVVIHQLLESVTLPQFKDVIERSLLPVVYQNVVRQRNEGAAPPILEQGDVYVSSLVHYPLHAPEAHVRVH